MLPAPLLSQPLSALESELAVVIPCELLTLLLSGVTTITIARAGRFAIAVERVLGGKPFDELSPMTLDPLVGVAAGGGEALQRELGALNVGLVAGEVLLLACRRCAQVLALVALAPSQLARLRGEALPPGGEVGYRLMVLLALMLKPCCLKARLLVELRDRVPARFAERGELLMVQAIDSC